MVWRDDLSGPAASLIVECAIAAMATGLVWRPGSPDEPSSVRASRQAHAHAFISFWSNGAGAVRIGLFAFCCILLLVAANIFESKWVGMLSALPLPGLFAVATLSTLQTREELILIRDTVLWGPVTVVLFNWIFAEAVAELPGRPRMARPGRACAARGAPGTGRRFDLLGCPAPLRAARLCAHA